MLKARPNGAGLPAFQAHSIEVDSEDFHQEHIEIEIEDQEHEHATAFLNGGIQQTETDQT